jgi:hypothetical protein
VTAVQLGQALDPDLVRLGGQLDRDRVAHRRNLLSGIAGMVSPAMLDSKL